MQSIELQVHPVREKEVAAGIVALERRKGDAWVREREWDVSSDDKSAYRKIVLEDDQRLVVETRPAVEVVYDRDTFRAREVPLDPVKRAEVEEEEKRVKAENIAAEEEARDPKKQKEKSEKEKAEPKAQAEGESTVSRTGLRDSHDVKGESISPRSGVKK